MRKNRFLLCGMITAAALLTSACGQTATEQTGGQTAVESTAESSTATEQTPSAKETGMDKKVEKIIGRWEAAAARSIYYSFEDQESSENYYFLDYDDGDVGLNEFTVYEENGVLMADFYEASYYGSSYYGMKGSVLQKQLYDGCKNAEWMCQFTSIAAQREGRTWNAALVDENVLEIYSIDKYEEYGYQYETITTYLREGSAENDNRDSYRYEKTIEVSNAAELVKALQENDNAVDILLNEGVYDISGEYGLFNNLYDMRIKGKDGARVEICIDDPYSSVVQLNGCNDVYLENLILGHAVEPGQCSGNVIQCDSSYAIRINNCKLYGSGAYGVSAWDSYDIRVSDSEIYECTYGLVEGYDSGELSFDKCIFRDTEGYSLIELHRCNWVTFSESVFKNCSSENDSEFVCWPESNGLQFFKCTFENNSYGSFSESEPDVIDCVFK